jgi:hypothetical protein
MGNLNVAKSIDVTLTCNVLGEKVQWKYEKSMHSSCTNDIFCWNKNVYSWKLFEMFNTSKTFWKKNEHFHVKNIGQISTGLCAIYIALYLCMSIQKQA